MNEIKNEKRLKFVVNDRRLRMGVLSRMAVRISGYAVNLFIFASTLVLLFSPLGWAKYLAAILGLFLLDRFVHRKEADRPISEAPIYGEVMVLDYVRPEVFHLLEKAYDKSLISKTNFPLEIFKELLSIKEVREGLKRLDVGVEEVDQKVGDFLSRGDRVDLPSRKERRDFLLAKMEVLLTEAFGAAIRGGHDFIEPASLFSALSGLKDEFIERIFSLFGIEKDDLEKAMIFGFLKRRFSRLKKLPASIGEFVRTPKRDLRHRVMNRAWTARPTPTLDRYGFDLTDLARQEKIGFLVGHKEEYTRLVDSLARPSNPNALLIGDAGIGKETLISHLAFDIAKDNVPPPLFDKRLVSLHLASLVAGADPDELHARLQRIVDEIISAGNVILYIPEIHNLVRTSGTAYLSAADALVPIFMDNDFPTVGSTYPKEFKESLEPRTDFSGVFEKIRVSEITEDEAEKVLVYESLILEREYEIIISFGAIKKAVALAKRYFRNKFLPSSADELLKGALVEAKRRGEEFLGPDTVVAVAESKVNIPIHEVTDDEASRLINLEATIHERLIDQEEAVKRVANVLREYRSGLTRPGGPIASFLFVGPTGVGKTELAKILARVQFGSTEMMVRFDMSEYQDKQSFFRLIGSPDGKIFGSLTEAILQKPYSLVLLDELEKAYPDILNLFLQVLDDGRLTDNLGRLVDFQHTIIIATSNAHSEIINEALGRGESMSQIAEYLKKKLVDVFKPELLNRFSKIVIFNNLRPEDLEKIALLNLKDFSALVKAQGITLGFSMEAVRLVSKLGYEPAFGARPLQRVIQDRLKAPLAEKILKKEVEKGRKYLVKVSGEEFEFELVE